MAQTESVLINGGRILIEDRSERFFVKFLSRFEERDSIRHRDLLPSSCSTYRTPNNSKKLLNSMSYERLSCVIINLFVLSPEKAT
jgi:hypothetical protein